MKKENILLIICPECGQVNVCGAEDPRYVCPACQRDIDILDEIKIELAR